MSININKWVSGLTDTSKNNLIKIVRVLRLAQERSSDTFKVPWDLFRLEKCGQTEVKEWLLALHRREIIYVVRILPSNPPLHTRLGQTVNRVTTIKDNPSIVFDQEDSPTITINNQFNELYTLFENGIDNQVHQMGESKSKLSRRELMGKIEDIAKIRQLGKKEKKFLKILADQSPHQTKKLGNEIETDDVKALKASVQRKVKGTGFLIKTTRGGKNPSYYQLEYLTSTKNTL